MTPPTYFQGSRPPQSPGSTPLILCSANSHTDTNAQLHGGSYRPDWQPMTRKYDIDQSALHKSITQQL